MGEIDLENLDFEDLVKRLEKYTHNKCILREWIVKVLEDDYDIFVNEHDKDFNELASILSNIGIQNFSVATVNKTIHKSEKITDHVFFKGHITVDDESPEHQVFLEVLMKHGHPYDLYDDLYNDDLNGGDDE